MSDSLNECFSKQQENDERQRFQLAMAHAQNTMRAVRIMVQEGDYDEAIKTISEALGETDG